MSRCRDGDSRNAARLARMQDERFTWISYLLVVVTSSKNMSDHIVPKINGYR
jgi:hypothetical protein